MKTFDNNLSPIRIVMLCILFLIGGGIQAAEGAYFFDFDKPPLSYPGGSSAIENYMTNIYGSDITVTNAIVGDGIFPGPLKDTNDPNDLYIQSDLSLGVDWFEISFNVPITSVSFDWGSTLNHFIAEADGDVIFDSGYVGYSSGTSGTYYFDSPVYTLNFHDGGLGEVEIDNLRVTSVPVPGAVWLLGSGLISLVGIRKKFNANLN